MSVLARCRLWSVSRLNSVHEEVPTLRRIGPRNHSCHPVTRFDHAIFTMYKT